MPAPAPATVDAYLAALPAERQAALSELRAHILAHLPPGFEEGIEFGMPCYYVPLARFPDTYNKRPLAMAAFASQKGYMSLYLMGIYDTGGREWFERAWADAGKRLDAGKVCVRFKRLSDLALDIVGQAIARFDVDSYVGHYMASRPQATRKARG